MNTSARVGPSVLAEPFVVCTAPDGSKNVPPEPHPERRCPLDTAKGTPESAVAQRRANRNRQRPGSADLQREALRLRAQIAIVDRAMDARLPIEAPADTSASDVLLTHLADAEHEALLRYYTLGRERMERGEAPQGGAVRRVIVPALADRMHQIVRVIVDPPNQDEHPPLNGRDTPRGDE